MAFRYDYRNDYKGYDLIQLESCLDNCKDRLLDWIGLNSYEESNYMKRISYLEGKIKKIKNNNNERCESIF